MAETTAIVTVLEDANKDTVIARFESLSRTITDSMPNSDSNFKITCDDSELAGIKAEAEEICKKLLANLVIEDYKIIN